MKQAGILFFIFVLLLTGILWLHHLTGPVELSGDTTIEFRIDPGSSASEIGDKLYRKGLIKSRQLFNLLIVVNGLDEKLQAGLYELKPSSTLRDIFNDLISGRVATFRVTIPEGFTVEEIAGRLAELTAYTREDFLTAAGNIERPYFPAGDADYKYQVEGFLYPDTYLIPRDFTPEGILGVMLAEFEAKWRERLPQSSQYSILEIVTMASLVEKEARLDEEKPLIAAVIRNRLEQGMLLQIDASVQYSLPDRKERVLYRDLKVDSPYNTYLNPGLPPGPVCSPGSKAIEAVLSPAEVDYLFYFALEDGSHRFNRTYQEHIKAQNEPGVNYE